MATEPQHSETMAGAAASSAPERSDVRDDAAVILAALGRMEAAVRAERAALGQLRTSLLDMAQAIARAKHVADSEIASAMLDEFEHRVDAMIEVAGGRAESDRVPTVSGVVSKLDPNESPPEAAAADTAQPAEATASSSPTVAMLTAMVEALSASIQVPAQETEQETEQEAEPETAVAQDVQEPEAIAAPAVEPEQMIEAAAPEAVSADPAVETALLASFVQMEARPFPPPEEGTAVIFTRAEPEPEAAPDDEPWPPASSEPVVTATLEQAAAPEVAEIPAAIEPEIAEAAPPPTITTETAAATVPPEAEFDPSDFLFGPEPEPDPAAFLLDPPPQQRKAVLPQAEFVSAPPAQELPIADESSVPEAPTAEVPPAPAAEAAPSAQPESAPDDPLRALKAMSENERLAIFS